MPEVALITGGTRGLGRALVEKFISEGWKVASCARSAEELENLKAEIASSDLLAEICDVTDRTSVVKFVEQTILRFDAIDVLINNAALIGRMSELLDYPKDVWDETMAANVTGPFNFVQAVVPAMVNRRDGVVINITSGAGVKGKRTWGAYAASKFALEGLTQVLWDEMLDTAVRVHAVDPGAMQTSMRAKAYPDEYPAQHPTPKEVARVIFDIAAVYEPQLCRLMAKEYL